MTVLSASPAGSDINQTDDLRLLVAERFALDRHLTDVLGSAL
jgi:hypothetical protein